MKSEDNVAPIWWPDAQLFANPPPLNPRHGRVQHIDCLVQFVLSLQGFIFILMLHRLSLVDGIYYS